MVLIFVVSVIGQMVYKLAAILVPFFVCFFLFPSFLLFSCPLHETKWETGDH